MAGEIKKEVSIPVIAIGMMTPEAGEKALEDGKADLIAIARGLLADPEIPKKTEEGRTEDIVPCIACLRCSTNCITTCIATRFKINPIIRVT